MKRLVLIILFWLVGILPLMAQGTRSETAFVMKEDSGQRFVLENVVDGFSIDTSMGFFSMEVSDFYSAPMHHVGCPSIPVVQKILAVPVGSTVEVEIITDKVEYHPLPIVQKMYPVQPSQPKSSEPTPWQIDSNVYTTDAYYSNRLVEVSAMGTMRGVQLVRLTISPFEYNPVRNTLKVHTLVKAQVKTASGTAGSRGFYPNPLLGPQLITKAYANDLHWGSDVPLKYVVVARDSFKEALQPFVRWKTQMGYNVVQ